MVGLVSSTPGAPDPPRTQDLPQNPPPSKKKRLNCASKQPNMWCDGDLPQSVLPSLSSPYSPAATTPNQPSMKRKRSNPEAELGDELPTHTPSVTAVKSLDASTSDVNNGDQEEEVEEIVIEMDHLGEWEEYHEDHYPYQNKDDGELAIKEEGLSHDMVDGCQNQDVDPYELDDSDLKSDKYEDVKKFALEVPTGLSCNLCDFIIKNSAKSNAKKQLGKMQRHLDGKHEMGWGKYNCSVCGNQFNTREKLTQHMKHYIH